MNADSLVAGLLIGAFFGLAGAGLLWYVRSEWSERQAQKAERMLGLDNDPFAPMPGTIDALLADHGLERGRSLTFALDRLHMAMNAERLADPETILFAVPEQRRPVEDVYDWRKDGA